MTRIIQTPCLGLGAGNVGIRLDLAEPAFPALEYGRQVLARNILQGWLGKPLYVHLSSIGRNRREGEVG